MSNPFYTYSGSFIPGTLARAEALAAEFSSVQSGFALAVTYGIDTGLANAYVVTTQGQPTGSYQDGNEVLFKAANTNTTAATINVNGVGVVNIYRYSGAATQSGDITAGTYYTLVYNSTYGGFTIIGPAAIVSTSNTISPAPPTHLVGLVAAGGVSTACVPIDATYALDQSISPTWTGAHTFNGSIAGSALTSYLLAPAPIGTTTPAAGKFTSLTATGTFTSKLIVDNGNVAISAPASGVTLAVTGLTGGSAQAMTITGGTTAGDAGLYISAGVSGGITDVLWCRNPTNTKTYFQVGSAGSFAIGWNGSAAIMSSAATGSVNINVTSGNYGLIINGGSFAGISLVANSGVFGTNDSFFYNNVTTFDTFFGSRADTIIHLSTNGVDRVTISSSATATVNVNSVASGWALALTSTALTNQSGILFYQNARGLLAAEVGVDGGQNMCGDDTNGDFVVRVATAGGYFRVTGDSINTILAANSTGVILGNSSSSTIRMNVGTATSATAGANGDVPAQVVGYIIVNINATQHKIPYYAT